MGEHVRETYMTISLVAPPVRLSIHPYLLFSLWKWIHVNHSPSEKVCYCILSNSEFTHNIENETDVKVWMDSQNESKQKALFFYHVWLNAGSCSMSEKSYSFRNLDQSVEINKANVIHWLITVNLKLRNEIREHLHPKAALGNHTFSSLSQSCLTASWAF